MTHDPALWVRLRDAGPHEQVVGAKSARLARLGRRGCEVPDGWVLTSAFTRHWVSESGLAQEAAQALRGLAPTDIRTGRVLARLRQRAMEAELPTACREAVLVLDGLGEVVAVRSSALGEDASAMSAGALDSRVPVDRDDMETALRHVLASQFTGRALLAFRPMGVLPMAFLVHAYRGGLSGVCFSHDPLTGEAGLVAVAAGSAGGVTDGAVGQPSDGALRDPVLCGALAAAVHEAAAMLGGPVDIEWVWDEGKLIVLQVREAHAARPFTGIVDQVYESELLALPLGSCRKAVERAAQKKTPARRLCAELGIPTWRGFYAFYHDAPGRGRAAQELLTALPGEWVRLEVPGRWRVMAHRKDLLQLLPAADGQTVVQVGQMLHPAEAEGVATVTDNGGVYVEAFPPAVNQKDGLDTPSTYLLDSTGARRQRRPGSFSRVGELRSGEYFGEHGPQIVEHDRYELDLNEHVLRTVFEQGILLRRRLGPLSFEFTVYGGDVYFQDVTPENRVLQELEVQSCGEASLMLSAGPLTGAALRVDDVAELEETALVAGVSAVPYSLAETQLARGGLLAARAEDLRRRHGKVVIVAPYPSIGLIPLVASVDGFLFERGNLLCHLAIVLRSAGVPARVDPDATLAAEDGQPLQGL